MMPLGTHRATDTLDNYALPFPLLHNQPTFKVCILMIKISDFAFNFFLSKSNQIHLPWNYSQDKKKVIRPNPIDGDHPPDSEIYSNR